MELHTCNQQILSSADQSAVAYGKGKLRPGNLPTPILEKHDGAFLNCFLGGGRAVDCKIESGWSPLCMCLVQKWSSNAGPRSEHGVDRIGVGAAAVDLGGACAGRRTGCGGPLRNGSTQIGAIEALVSALRA